MDMLGPQAARWKAALDVAAARHRVIASNIANVNTPGYKAKRLRFDETLREMVVEERDGVVPREDGSTVVLEVEVGEMRKNSLAYRIFIEALRRQTMRVRDAVTGGRG